MGDGIRRDGKNKRLFVTSKEKKSFEMLTAVKYFHPSSNIEIDPEILEQVVLLRICLDKFQQLERLTPENQVSRGT